MYGNAPFASATAAPSLSPDQRKVLRRDLTRVAARTREFLPGEYVVGSELSEGADGPRATVAVQPPIGSVVSADYSPPDDAEVGIDDEEREDLATGLAASAALQVKQAMGEETSPTAQ
jgi:hypothetical protein